jgi:hypothetical protein
MAAIVFETKQRLIAVAQETEAARRKPLFLESDQQKAIAKLQKEREEKNNEFEVQENQIKRETHEMKRKRRANTRARTASQVQRDQGTLALQERAAHGFQQRFDQQKSEKDGFQNELQTVKTDAQRVLQRLKDFIQESINITKQNLTSFMAVLQKHEITQKSRVKQQLSVYAYHYRQAMFGLKQPEIILVNQLKNELVKLGAGFQEQARILNGKHSQMVSEETKRYCEIENARKNQLREIWERKQTAKQTTMREMKEHFQRDLATRKEMLENGKDEQLNRFQAEMEPNALVLEEDPEIRRLKAKLAFIDKQIEDQQHFHNRRVEKLAADVIAVAKQTRQFARRKKSEHQAINDEYERDIAIAQVQLRQKIENLSKLYTEDENHRGREIIEAVRKVKDMEHRRLDSLLNEKHRHEESCRQSARECKAIADEIGRVRAGTREAALEAQIIEVQTHHHTALAALQQTFDVRGKAIQAMIEKKEAEFANVQVEDSHGPETLPESNENAASVTAWETEFDGDVDKGKRRHEALVDHIRAEIAAARSAQEQLRSAQTQARTELSIRLAQERLTKLADVRLSARASTERRGCEIDSAIIRTMEKLRSVRCAFFFPTMRLQESRIIERHHQTLSGLNTRLRMAFETHCRSLAGASASAPPKAMNSARRPSKNSVRSGVCIDGKRLPLLVMPQMQ